MKGYLPHIRDMFIGAVLVTAYMLYMGGLSAIGVAAWGLSDLPDTDRLWAQSRPVSVKFLDRFGRDLETRGAREARYAKMDDLPQFFTQAILATEDGDFYNHIGVDPISLARASLANLRSGHYGQGGSTLTQQLTKNVFLTSQKTMKRKIHEALLSVWLEFGFTKDEVFEKYVNRIYFGSGAWGIEAASQRYFQKDPQGLNLTEAAMLAGLLKAPSRYNPHINPDGAATRTALVLKRMYRAGFISKSDYEEALSSRISVAQNTGPKHMNYFFDWVMRDVKKIMKSQAPTDLIIHTTLDADAQAAAQTAIETYLDDDRHVSQAALLSLDGTGAVRAMIGGADFGESEFNRVVDARRQPGSAFKPFVYLTAFEAGLSPWDVRIDEEISLGDWTPRNFKDDFYGPVTLEQAFKRSINTVAVGLAEEVGREPLIHTAERFGLTGLKPLRSLALGAQDQTLLNLTQSYLPFANLGYKRAAYGIVSITDGDGYPVYDYRPDEGERVIERPALMDMNRIMREVVTGGTARRANLTGHDVSGKTGTTNDYRDAWFMGYVPDLVTGVWVGNDDFSPMDKVTGGTIPADIWRDFMAHQLAGRPVSRLMMSTPEQIQNRQALLELSLNQRASNASEPNTSDPYVKDKTSPSFNDDKPQSQRRRVEPLQVKKTPIKVTH